MFQYSDEYVQEVSGGSKVAGRVREDESVGVNVGVKKVLAFIRLHQPVNANTIATHFPEVTQRTVERWIKALREQGEIEFRGASKTGGYYSTEN